MYIKPDLLPHPFGRLPVGGSSVVTADRSGDSKPSFASVIQEFLGPTGQGAGEPDPSSPLDHKTVQELVLKISEGMNRSLLSLVVDEGAGNGIGALFSPGPPVELSLNPPASEQKRQGYFLSRIEDSPPLAAESFNFRIAPISLL
jgi:hypothetical protein